MAGTNYDFENFRLMQRFLGIASTLKNEILLRVRDESAPPEELPPFIIRYLMSHLQLHIDDIRDLWTTFRNVLWLSPTLPLEKDDMLILQEKGPVSSDRANEQICEQCFILYKYLRLILTTPKQILCSIRLHEHVTHAALGCVFHQVLVQRSRIIVILKVPLLHIQHL